MKTLLITICITLLFYADDSNSISVYENKFVNNLFDTTVYICNSTSAKKYHYKKNCRGLNRCKKETKAITLASARKRGRTLCGWED